MGLRRKIVDFRRLDLLKQTVQIAGIRHIAVMQEQAAPLLMRVFVKMVDPLRIEVARPPDNPVNLISFFQQKLRQIGTVLPGNACNQRPFHKNILSLYSLDDSLLKYH